MDFNSIFLNKMKILLRDDYPQFLESYQQPPTRGVRVNTLLGDVSQFLKYSNLKLSPIPHCTEGFYQMCIRDRCYYRQSNRCRKRRRYGCWSSLC